MADGMSIPDFIGIILFLALIMIVIVVILVKYLVRVE